MSFVFPFFCIHLQYGNLFASYVYLSVLCAAAALARKNGIVADFQRIMV